MSIKQQVTLTTKDTEPKAGDFAIWETEDNEKHIVRVRANDHGRVYFNFNGSDRGDYSSNLTVIGTLIEPAQLEPLRWVENCKPDKPGIWAWVVDDGMFEATWISGPSSISECVIGTWCYLGPIPEILPPKKKVVQRLWILHSKQTATDAAEYLQSWIPDAHQGTLFGNWIRTDETREVTE